MIYAEWFLNDEFYCDLFTTWDAFSQATYNPDIQVLHVQELNW